MCVAPSWRKWEDVRYPTFLGRRHKGRWTHSPQTRSWNKMAVLWSYFRYFVGAQKIEDLTESQNFFAELFQITSRFVLAKKKLGVRCTLIITRGKHIYLLWGCNVQSESALISENFSFPPGNRRKNKPIKFYRKCEVWQLRFLGKNLFHIVGAYSPDSSPPDRFAGGLALRLSRVWDSKQSKVWLFSRGEDSRIKVRGCLSYLLGVKNAVLVPLMVFSLKRVPAEAFAVPTSFPGSFP